MMASAPPPPDSSCHALCAPAVGLAVACSGGTSGCGATFMEVACASALGYLGGSAMMAVGNSLVRVSLRLLRARAARDDLKGRSNTLAQRARGAVDGLTQLLGFTGTNPLNLLLKPIFLLNEIFF